MAYMFLCVSAFAFSLVFASAYSFKAAVRHKKQERNGRKRNRRHTRKNTHTHTHAAPGMGALNHNTSKTIKEKQEAWDDQRTHTLITPVKQNTHTGREREVAHSMQWKQKQKQLRCSAHAARQDGSGACRAKESTNGPAWVCMHIYNGHIIVCASWGEVRARVHARGHTHRELRTSVCAGGARLSLPHSHAATTAAAAAHATTRRSKRGKVVWEAAVLPSLSPGVVV
ncbi:protein kinase, putative [Trypanosoma cruzi]|nr:protein kinase, putative [Trypanosoma cruzi]